MAVIGTLTNSRKYRWFLYMALSAGFAVYCYYDGWHNPKYRSPDELSNLWFNRIGAVALAVLFVVLIVRFQIIRRQRVVADDNGLDVNGKFIIPWSAITRLEDRNLEKGLLDLFYTESGREKKYTLDSYKVTSFEEMVDTLSRHRPDLLAVEEAEDAGQGGGREPKERA